MINSVIATLSYVLPTVALALVSIVIFISLYFRIRKLFHTSVNCWFCNTWTKVPYELRNSFDCPSCSQYNGFDKDGGYNKVIAAQYDKSLNKEIEGKHYSSGKASNGLCALCNNNQQLKIYQLAHFVPLREEHYDEEIEHFQKQLEKAYRLCKKCDLVLNNTLRKQTAWIFGNHLRNIKRSGISLFDLNKSSCGVSKEKKSFYLATFINYLLKIFSLLIIYNNTVAKLTLSEVAIDEFVPDPVVPYAVLSRDLWLLFKNITSAYAAANGLDAMTEYAIYSNLKYLSSVGLFLQITKIFMESSEWNVRINQVLCWSILMVSSATNWENEQAFYISILQIFCATLAFFMASNNRLKVVAKRKPDYPNHVDNFEDISDVEEDENDETAQSPTYFVEPRISKEASKSPSLFKTESFRTSPILNTSARSTYSTNTQPMTAQNSGKPVTDLNHSLDNLHLDPTNIRSNAPSPVYSISSQRQILSPPKLKTSTQNSWVAGGFWRNADGTMIPVSGTNLSRSSSQSSGFGSQTNENYHNPFYSLPTSRDNSVCGENDRASLLSEPAYHMKSQENFSRSTPLNVGYQSQLYYKCDNTFYPVLGQNSMLSLNSNSANFVSVYRGGVNPSVGIPHFLGGNQLHGGQRLFKNL